MCTAQGPNFSVYSASQLVEWQISQEGVCKKRGGGKKGVGVGMVLRRGPMLPRLAGDLCCCGNELVAVPDGLELLWNGELRL